MKQVILFLSISFILYSCSSSDDSKKRDHLAIAANYVEAVETNTPAVMDSLRAASSVGYGPSVGDSINKADAIANWKFNAENLYESMKYTRHQSVAVSVTEGDPAALGDWVTHWAYLTIKYKDGRGQANVWVNAVYKIENGKIARSRTFYNEADVLRQLGYTMEPPQLGE